MKTSEVDAYLCAKPGAEKDFKAEWEWWRYLVGGKMFAAEFTVGPEHKEPYKGRRLLTLKCDPAHGRSPARGVSRRRLSGVLYG